VKNKRKYTLESLSDTDLISMYEQMLVTREFELGVCKINARKSLPENPHLCIGQEAVGVGACYNLRKEDVVMPSLRGRSVLITKGVPLGVIMAGIYGKATGPSKGKHTAHHMGDPDIGILASSLLIGSQIPIATGAAMAFKYQKKDNVSLCFLGDGATNRGDFHESLNIAAIMSLPIVYICENNHYAIDTRVENSMLIDNISIRADSYGIPGETVDGMNVIEVHQSVQKAVALARQGKGSSLIECKTYRFKSHSERFPESRPKEEIESWMDRCPIKYFREVLIEKKILTKQKDAEIHMEVQKRINEAIQFAEESPYPSDFELLEDVYTKGYIKDGRLCMT
jgi:TPP-dependent pyruvate/acetoin dehydrogenase alpha subunit